MQDLQNVQQQIEQAWQNRELLKNEATQDIIRGVIDLLDKGSIRIAEPKEAGWQINE